MTPTRPPRRRASRTHHLEHELSKLDDGVKAALKRLQDAERENTRRIEELERRVGEAVATKVEDGLNTRIGRLEGVVATSVDARVRAHGYAWMLPFGGLAVAMAGVTALGYKKYRKLLKSHLL